MAKLSSNIWKLYVYRVIGSMQFVLPVFALFLLDNNLSLTQVMILQAWYAIALLAFEIPTGAFADRHGRKTSIIISAVMIFIACFVYASGRLFLVFLAAETLWAIAASFWSGADTAFLFDTLKALKREDEFKKIYGTFYAIESISYGIAGIIGGFLVVYGLRFPFYMTLIPLGIAMIIPFTLKEPQLFRKVKYKYWAHIKEAVKYTARNPRLRFIILYAAIFAVVGEVLYFLWQPYLKSAGVPITLFGIIFAIFTAVNALGSKLAHKIEPRLGEKATLLMAVLIPAIALILMGWIIAVYSLLFLLAFEFAEGILRPVLTSYVQHHIESYRRATILSLKNMSRSLAVATIAPLVGAIADYWTIQAAFLISGITLLVYFAILAAVFIIFRK